MEGVVHSGHNRSGCKDHDSHLLFRRRSSKKPERISTHVISPMGCIAGCFGVTLDSVKPAAEAKARHSAEEVERQGYLVVQSRRGWKRIRGEREMGGDEVEWNQQDSDDQADEVSVNVNCLIMDIWVQHGSKSRYTELTSERAVNT